MTSNKALPNSFSFNQLGLSDHNAMQLLTAIEDPYGTVLFSGPTGSGKTATLHSALSHIAKHGVETLAIEDPIEYLVPNTKQYQLAEGTTYAQAIKKLMWSDPDNIVVGEINDAETASAALSASLTGHSVFSTIHAKSASAVPSVLADLGIPAHVVRSSLSAVVNQRLIRTLCENCKEQYSPEPEELLFSGFSVSGKYWVEGDETPELYRARRGGCAECAGTGFRGHTAAYEVLRVDEAIRHLIYTSAGTATIEEQAVKNGMVNIVDDGWDKVLHGTTTIQEVIRAIIA